MPDTGMYRVGLASGAGLRSAASPSAKVQADGQESHRRLGPRASQHKMTKPIRYSGEGNAVSTLKVHVLIQGICPTCGPCLYGSRTEAQIEKGRNRHRTVRGLWWPWESA